MRDFFDESSIKDQYLSLSEIFFPTIFSHSISKYIYLSKARLRAVRICSYGPRFQELEELGYR